MKPKFCFICGGKLEKIDNNWMQCENNKCNEMFLTYDMKENENNVCLVHQKTPFSPKDK